MDAEAAECVVTEPRDRNANVEIDWFEAEERLSHGTAPSVESSLAFAAGINT